MISSHRVIDQVRDRLDAFSARMREETATYGPEAAAFLSAVTATLDGGKRLRARFCHAGWASAATPVQDGSEPTALWDVCAALEVFQSAALTHDDLIDNSDARRGRPSAHRALEAAHAAQGWSGNSAAFGRASAVLLGDLLVAWSDDLLESGIATNPQAGLVRAEYARMRRDVTLGQYLDIAEESAWAVVNPDDLAERALRVVWLKAARYSVEQPLLIGAALANADPAQRNALRAYGHPLGMAFQLRDDVLGVFGDERITGKPAGDDLREGKRTLLIAWTRQALAPSGRRLVDEMLGDPSLTPDQIATLQAIITESGALRRMEERIVEYIDAAEEALQSAPLQPPALDLLRGLSRDATQRTA